MIKFFLKLWELNRPYKGRFLLGVFFGILNGMAPMLLLATALFAISLVFPGSQATQWVEMIPEVPAWVPAAVQHNIGHMKDALAHFQGWATKETGTVGGLAVVVGLIPLVALLRGVVAYLNTYLISWAAIRTISGLRARLFDHLLNLPLSFFTGSSTGELMSRANDLTILQNVLADSMVILIKSPISVLSYTFVMLLVDWKLTLISFSVLLLCVFPISIYSRKGRRASAAIQTEQAALNRVIHESFTGNRIIKAYNLEGVIVADYNRRVRVFIGQFMRVVRATETPGPLIEFVGALGLAGLILYLRAVRGSQLMGVGAFVGPLVLMYAPIKDLTRLYSKLTQAQAATQRVFELLGTPNTLTDPPNPAPLRADGAVIQFDNVSFGYGKAEVLHQVQVTVKPGQMVALVGPTGSGKTTLTNLLLRFYDPTGGAVRIGGVDLRQVALRDLRSQIAVVTQDVILFNDTIFNNIACGRPGASAAEVEAAARHAHAHEFIMEKPGGYQAGIGEKGVTLSGGQRQRISLARAILKNAPILVLDEATSSLDNESERTVQKALDGLMEGRTSLCIAHRLSTVQHADVILVLDNGRMVETGTHAELLALGGLYHKLHSLQFR